MNGQRGQQYFTVPAEVPRQIAPIIGFLEAVPTGTRPRDPLRALKLSLVLP